MKPELSEAVDAMTDTKEREATVNAAEIRAIQEIFLCGPDVATRAVLAVKQASRRAERPAPEAVLFDPARLPPPDEMGFFFHPDIPEDHDNDPASTEVVQSALKARGWECAWISDDEIMDDRGEYDATKWEPIAPDGGGWQLVAKYDTEDGPAAMFVRPLAPSRPAAGGPDMTVGRASAPTTGADSRSSPTPVPLTTEEKP